MTKVCKYVLTTKVALHCMVGPKTLDKDRGGGGGDFIRDVGFCHPLSSAQYAISDQHVRQQGPISAYSHKCNAAIKQRIKVNNTCEAINLHKSQITNHHVQYIKAGFHKIVCEVPFFSIAFDDPHISQGNGVLPSVLLFIMQKLDFACVHCSGSPFHNATSAGLIQKSPHPPRSGSFNPTPSGMVLFTLKIRWGRSSAMIPLGGSGL